MPGGVSSPVRSFKSVGLSPVFIKSGQGAYLTDVDGNNYVDYVMSYGPLIAGHAHPAVRAAVAKQISRGSSFGCCSELEITLATFIAGVMPGVPMVRFVNSGTEAVTSALRLARGATGRPLIVKCAGCYHGHVDALLVQAGSGATTHGQPSSPGIPDAVINNTLLVPFNDAAAAEAVFSQHGGQIAAMIVEPILGNIGVVLPEAGYLARLRELCSRHGVLLIFDEVMTGFRVALGGAQQLQQVQPDITCLGKIIGGGLPVGAYGGRAELMNQVSPAGPVYQAGTLSGNPLAMIAGLTTLRLLQSAAAGDAANAANSSQDAYAVLEALGSRLQHGLEKSAARAEVPLVVQRCGSMITPFFTGQSGKESIKNYADALACDTQAYARFFKAMLDGGVMLPPSQFEAWFISLAHTEADIDQTVEAAAKAFEAVKQPAAQG